MKHDEAKLRLYLTHRPALIDYATPIVGCRMRAEDLVQEAYLRFVQAAGVGRPPSSQDRRATTRAPAAGVGRPPSSQDRRATTRAPAEGKDHPVEQPVSYLYRIVRNLALDWKRRLSAENRRDRARLLVVDPLPAVPSPEEEALFRDELRRVEAALAELPDRVRRAFEMHRIGGLTFQQIAERLDVSVATAGRWAQQALLHVTKRLQGPRG